METPFDYDSKPIIPIDILVPNEKDFDTNALIDSGSDINFSYAIVGRILGLKFSRKPTDEITGIDRKVRGWTRTIKMRICGEIIDIDVMFLNTRKFNSEIDTPLILGRDPLFNKFDIEFKNNCKIIFKK